MYTRKDIEELAEKFEDCRKVLVALGDENRQHLILEMMKMGKLSIVQEKIFDDILITYNSTEKERTQA